MNECVLCDWTYDPLGTPLVVCSPPESPLPLRWEDAGVRTVQWAEVIADTVQVVALAAHWAQAHPEQLRGLLDGADSEIRMWGTVHVNRPEMPTL